MVDAVIRLFNSTARTFTSNGIGYLPDAIDCRVVEERNGGFELSMTYPINGRYFSEILTRRILVAKSDPFSEPQPFRIYEITKPINGKVKIYAEHISYDLSGIPVRPFMAKTAISALQGLKSNALIECPFEFMTDKSTTAAYVVPLPTTIRSELGGVQGSILDTFRGEYEFDRFTVNLWNNRGINRGVTLRYGKNITDLEQEENISNVYTGVYPYWYSDLEEGGGLVQGTIVNCPGTYNFKKILVLDCSYDFQEKPTVQQLTQFATSYISANNIGIPKVSLTVSFVDLADADEYQDIAMLLSVIRLCDTLNISYEKLGVNATAKCVKTDYNVLTGKYNSIELGDAKPSLTDAIASNNDKLAEDFQKELITNLGMSKEEYEKALDKAYKELLGDIGSLENSVSQDLSNLNNKMEEADRQLTEMDKAIMKDLADAEEEILRQLEQAAQAEATAREKAIANATKLITGNLGGYVILHSSTGADYPDEILIMDENSVSKARKIWRWNKGGLGYSNTGYNGPYGLAITQDGSIVANYIKTGALNASLITTGFLNASIIKGGTLILGGRSNGNGTFILRDNNDVNIGFMNNSGLTINKGVIRGPSIYVGGANNTNGIIQVLNRSGGIAAQLDNESLVIYGNIYFNGDEIPGYTIFQDASIGTHRKSDGLMTYLQRSFRIVDHHEVGVGPVYKSGYSFMTYEDFIGMYNLRKDENGQYLSDLIGYFDRDGSNLRSDFSVMGRIRAGKTSSNWENGGEVYFDGGQKPTYITQHNPGKQDNFNPALLFICCSAIFRIESEYGAYAPISAGGFNNMSSRRYKENIQPLTEDEAKKILKIEPVTFDYKKGIGEKNCRGVIAEDVFEHIPSVVTMDYKGDPDSVDYSKFTPYLIKMVQMLQSEVDALKQEIKELRR